MFCIFYTLRSLGNEMFTLSVFNKTNFSTLYRSLFSSLSLRILCAIFCDTITHVPIFPNSSRYCVKAAVSVRERVKHTWLRNISAVGMRYRDVHRRCTRTHSMPPNNFWLEVELMIRKSIQARPPVSIKTLTKLTVSKDEEGTTVRREKGRR